MAACQDNLTSDIYLDILEILALKSLIRFKAVCKFWKSTISSADFIDRHSDRSATNPSKLAIVLNEYSGFDSKCSIFFHTLDFSATCSGEISTIEHTVTNCRAADPLSWCRGFLLLRVECYPNSLLLWNPSTRESKKVPKPPICYHYRYESIFASALGYDFALKTHKIVLICETPRGRHSNIFFVYNVKTNSWTSLNVDKNHEYHAYYEKPSTTLVNGAPHWWVSYAVSHDNCYFEIECFDFSTNQFLVIPQPDDNDDRALETTELSNLEGLLCMGCFLCDKVTIWVMEEYGVKESWSRLMVFNDIVSPICFAKTNNVSLVSKYVVQEKRDRYHIYNGTERGIELEFLAGREVTSKSAFAFTESLISLETEKDVGEERQEEPEPKIEFGKLIIGDLVWW